jgi:hypothetical protein
MPPIPPILADAFANWTLGIAIAAVLIAAAGQITMWITMKAPQKREVSFTECYMAKEECEKRMVDMAKTAVQVKADLVEHAKSVAAIREADAAAAKKDRGDLYNHIDGVRLELKADIHDLDQNSNDRITQVLTAVSEVRGELAASNKTK